MNAYLTASNSNLATVIDRALDNLSGATIQGNDLRLTLNLRGQRAAMAALGTAAAPSSRWSRRRVASSSTRSRRPTTPI